MGKRRDGEGKDGPLTPQPAWLAPRWLRRLGWMVALWAGGVGALFLVASLLRALMHAAGMR